MKRKFKQRWSTISPIAAKRTFTSRLKLMNTKKDDDIYPGLWMGQAHTCGGFNMVNEILSI